MRACSFENRELHPGRPGAYAPHAGWSVWRVEPQDAFDRCCSTLRPSGPRASVVHRWLEDRAPSSPPPLDPPCQGLGPRLRASASGSCAPKSARPLARDALSRSLQPTSCHEHPTTSLLPRRTLARPCPAARPGLLCRARSHASVGPCSPLAPKDRCRCLRPRVVVRCAPHPPAAASLASLPGRPLWTEVPMTRCPLVRLGFEPVELSC